MKCKRCKKGKLLFVINSNDGNPGKPLTHRILLCQYCGKATINKLKMEKI